MRIDVDDAVPRRALEEQPRLAVEVLGHVRVIVEMIARQVREDSRIEPHPVNTSLRQGVRRHFDGRIDGILVDELGKLPVQVNNRRRRHADGAFDIADAVAERANVPTGLAEKLAGLRKHPRHGRLAVGPGHANNVEAFRRAAVEAIRDLPDPLREIVNGDHRQAGVFGLGPGRGVPRDRTGARLTRLLEEIETVRRQTLNREKQVAVPELPTVACDAEYGNVRRFSDSPKHIREHRCRRHVFDRRAHRLSARAATDCITLPGSRAGSASGATARSRSDSDMTLANTGAATSLP